MAFAVPKDSSVLTDNAAAMKLEGEIMKRVDGDLGAVARPARVHFVSALPKTRSGKMLRRAIQAVCEGRDPGDLTTMTPQELVRLHGPIGLYIGSKTPPEIAISILAELTAVKNQVALPRAVGIAEAKAEAGLAPTGEVCELPVTVAKPAA